LLLNEKTQEMDLCATFEYFQTIGLFTFSLKEKEVDKPLPLQARLGL
jgi:hypothetical protein